MVYKNKRCFACVHQYLLYFVLFKGLSFGLPATNYLRFSGMFALTTSQRPLMMLISLLPKITFSVTN